MIRSLDLKAVSSPKDLFISITTFGPLCLNDSGSPSLPSKLIVKSSEIKRLLLPASTFTRVVSLEIKLVLDPVALLRTLLARNLFPGSRAVKKSNKSYRHL